MKNFIWVWLVIIFSGCSNKYESVVNSAPQPGLSFNRDTVSIREKDYNNITRAGGLTVYCPNAGHELNMVLSDTSGKVHFYYRGSSIQNGQPLVVIDSVNLFVTCDTSGVFPVDFLITDQLGRMFQKTLIVNCTANQKAIPSFFYVPLGSTQLQSWEYVFDGSLSADPDGTISMYHYSINGQLIDTNKPVFHFTFHAKGEHIIGLFLTDDLGLISDTLFQKLTIQ